jgi:hypothetical protein
MSRNKYKSRLGVDTPTQDELLADMEEAQFAGSQDLISAALEANTPNSPNVIDKEKFYGDFYDSIKPDIKHLRGTLSRTMAFNGDTFDRVRNNEEIVLLKKISHDGLAVGQIESGNVINYNSRGAIILIDLTDKNALDALTVSVEGKETANGLFYNILITPLLVNNELVILKIYPGLNPVPGFVSNDILPRTWRVTVAHAAAPPILYGITAHVIL